MMILMVVVVVLVIKITDNEDLCMYHLTVMMMKKMVLFHLVKWTNQSRLKKFKLFLPVEHILSYLNLWENCTVLASQTVCH